MMLAEAEAMGTDLAKAGHTVIYGGCTVGMMGRLADGALAQGGEVWGVIPELDFAEGIVHPRLTQKKVVPTLSARKTQMLEWADAAIALPGGLGTLDEIFETLVLKAMGHWPKPFWLMNSFDFWSPLLEALTLMVESRMINRPLVELYEVAERREDLILGLKGIR